MCTYIYIRSQINPSDFFIFVWMHEYREVMREISRNFFFFPFPNKGER